MSDAPHTPTTVSRVPTADGAPDIYDHEIDLVDTTVSDAPAEPTRTRTRSPSGSWRKIGIARVPTRSSVKHSYNKRKYAKYQEHRYNKSSGPAGQGEDQPASPRSPPNETTEAVDFAHQQSEARPRSRSPRKKHHHHHKPEYAIDVLYENQRGSFFFGIPLYSHSSLLNFDPSAWVNKEYKDSPVNITNAQVPDPTWEWAWKTWYVDMSYDVDEEGWQYSFSFGKGTAWHGTHPWFHSFVRRRRWLRKRMKRTTAEPGAPKASNLSAAHRLTAEYFTIHPKRDRSRSPGSLRPESYASIVPATEFEEPPEDIKDIATLLKSLRLATIDRAKIDLVKRFVISAPADELSYLGTHIPDVMSHLVFQNSRRQLLLYLRRSADEAREHRGEPVKDSQQRIDNLLAAIDEAEKEIAGLEYWSDRKHVLKTADEDTTEREDTKRQSIAPIFDASSAPHTERKLEPAGDIRGISKEAEVEKDGTRRLAKAVSHSVNEDIDDANSADAEARRKRKGKQRAGVDGAGDDSGDDDNNDGEKEEVGSPLRLKQDQVLIPDTE
jgi:hypothetical protein